MIITLACDSLPHLLVTAAAVTIPAVAACEFLFNGLMRHQVRMLEGRCTYLENQLAQSKLDLDQARTTAAKLAQGLQVPGADAAAFLKKRYGAQLGAGVIDYLNNPPRA